MTLQPNFLPVGSIVEYNLGDKDFPNWSPTSLDWQDLKRLDENPGLFNCEHRGIKLTPEILTEWCNMKRTENVDFVLGNFTVVACGVRLPQDEWEYRYKDTVIEYLHELQMAYLVHMKQVLTVTIK